MEAIEYDNKPKTHKGKLYLEKRQPKDKEDPKKMIFINTNKTSEIMGMVLHDLVYIFS